MINIKPPTYRNRVSKHYKIQNTDYNVLINNIPILMNKKHYICTMENSAFSLNIIWHFRVVCFVKQLDFIQ